jgi:hypothetical protein
LVINLPLYLTLVANNTHLLAGSSNPYFLALLEKEIESCEQVNFSLRMR